MSIEEAEYVMITEYVRKLVQCKWQENLKVTSAIPPKGRIKYRWNEVSKYTKVTQHFIFSVFD